MADQILALEAINVTKCFGGVKAVDSVDLKVQVGERRALIGPNGAGKTTLFNLITGEMICNEGSLHMFGTEITSKTIQERAKLGLGRTYQVSQLFLALTVEENLFLASVANKRKYFDMLHNWKKNEAEITFAHEVSNKVEISGLLNKKVSELSHGEQRQLEIGMAFAMQPKLIMLDEPAAGLSPNERITLTSLIKKLPPETTLILIEHDMDIVLGVADKITVLNRGAVLTEGTPSEIRNNEIVQNIYLGSAYVGSEA